MAASISGVVGKITWAYYVAAAINGYTVTRGKTDKVWSLRATVVQVDRYKLAQRPLVFAAPHERGEWRWPVQAITLNPDTQQLHATLGEPVEMRRHEPLRPT